MCDQGGLGGADAVRRVLMGDGASMLVLPGVPMPGLRGARIP